MSYPLETIRSFRRAHVGWPRSLELEAVWSETTAGWSLAEMIATAEQGLAEADKADIRQLIADEGLSVSVAEAEAHVLRLCRERQHDGARD